MKKKNNLELFIFFVFFLIVIIGIPAYIFQYSLYSCIIFVVGFSILIGSYLISLSIFPESETKKNWSRNSVINLSVSLTFVAIYLFSIDKFEDYELHKFGIRTYGIIKSRVRSKSSKYFSVSFQNKKGNQFESKTYDNSYKLGDTISVLYSERIPEINREY